MTNLKRETVIIAVAVVMYLGLMTWFSKTEAQVTDGTVVVITSPETGETTEVYCWSDGINTYCE